MAPKKTSAARDASATPTAATSAAPTSAAAAKAKSERFGWTEPHVDMLVQLLYELPIDQRTDNGNFNSGGWTIVVNGLNREMNCHLALASAKNKYAIVCTRRAMLRWLTLDSSRLSTACTSS